MQDIYIIATSLVAVRAHSDCGKWTWEETAGVWYAVCEPRRRTARAQLTADVSLTVLPPVSDPGLLAPAVVAALAAHGALATDTARSFLARCLAAGVGIFDPDI